MAGYKRKKIQITRKKKDAVTKKRERRFIFVFLALLILIASASTITYFREKAKEEAAHRSESDLTAINDGSRKEKVNILFIPVSSDDEVLYLCIFGMDNLNNSFTVSCVTTPDGADPAKPLELMELAEKAYGIKLDRYVMITRDQFKSFSQALGGYEVNLKNRIDYTGKDFTLSLPAGKRTLYGDLFFNYVRFTGLGGTAHEREKQAELLADYIRQRINKDTVENADEIFSGMFNTCTTNINISDFNRYQPTFKAAVEKKLKISVLKLENDE